MSAGVLAERYALVVAPPADERRKITGLTMAERGRRVAVLAGVAAARVVVVRSAAELAERRAMLEGKPLVIAVAASQVVAVSLLAPLSLDEPGQRRAVDPLRGGEAAGAWVLDAAASAAALDALARAWGAAASPADLLSLDLGEGFAAVEVDRRARFPIRGAQDFRAAIRWQYELVNKPLDAPICRYFYRPLARPLTILFLRSPLSPNVISVISILLSLVGCAVAASGDLTTHVVGLLLLLAGGIVDTNDGEVARLRLEMSKTGAWIDAMGDDMARIGLLLGMGGHVAANYPAQPVWPVTLAAVAMTITSLVLIYWYCIYVIDSSNNQDYTKALQIGPGVRTDGPQTFGARIADLGAQIVRRDFIDLAAVFVAIAGGSVVTFSLLAVGSLVTLIVVIPTHLKIVKAIREGVLRPVR